MFQVVIDNKNKLIGTLTDGDIRRSIFEVLVLNNQLKKLLIKNLFL